MKISKKCFNNFDPIMVRGIAIIPFVRLVAVKDGVNLKMTHLARKKEQFDALEGAGIFRLPDGINSPGDVIVNGGIIPDDWFFKKNQCEQLFKEEIAKKSNRRWIIASNGNNAPLHEWELNYAKGQEPALAAWDHQKNKELFSQRPYFCLSQKSGEKIKMEYLRFSKEGEPLDSEIETAIGGRPLVIRGEKVPPAEILKTSITDPRHVINLPDVFVNDRDAIPLGIRSIQACIRKEGGAEEIADKIIANQEFEFNEWGYYGKNVSEKEIEENIKEALRRGYDPEDYDFNYPLLKIKLKFNPYRHTFWARKGEDLLIGIITNDFQQKSNLSPLEQRDQKVLKSTGLSMPQLQTFLVKGLGVEDAILLGNGKDTRIYLSKFPHAFEQIEIIADNDSNARGSITGGMLSLSGS